jgi:hypothetical protein
VKRRTLVVMGGNSSGRRRYKRRRTSAAAASSSATGAAVVAAAGFLVAFRDAPLVSADVENKSDSDGDDLGYNTVAVDEDDDEDEEEADEESEDEEQKEEAPHADDVRMAEAVAGRNKAQVKNTWYGYVQALRRVEIFLTSEERKNNHSADGPMLFCSNAANEKDWQCYQMRWRPSLEELEMFVREEYKKDQSRNIDGFGQYRSAINKLASRPHPEAVGILPFSEDEKDRFLETLHSLKNDQVELIVGNKIQFKEQGKAEFSVRICASACFVWCLVCLLCFSEVLRF